MADSIMLATARAWNATLWSQDADFAKIPGVRFVAKRGSGWPMCYVRPDVKGWSRFAAATGRSLPFDLSRQLGRL